MECILWVQTLIHVLHQYLQFCMQYHIILNCIIMALHCNWYFHIMYEIYIRWAVFYSLVGTYVIVEKEVWLSYLQNYCITLWYNFYPRPVLAFGYFALPNSDQKSKTPWLRSLIFFFWMGDGGIVHAIIHHLSKIRFPNLDQKMHLSTVKIPVNFGLQSHF